MAATSEPDQPNAPPSEEIVAAIRAHHHQVHGLELDLRRDVYYPGNAPDGTIYDVTPITPKSAARYFCKTCGPGTVFIVGEPAYGIPQRRAFLALNDRHLQTLLAATPHQRRDELIDAYDRGELGPAMLAATNARKRRQTAVRHSAAYAQRIEGFRRYFFDAYAQTGSIERTCEQLLDLHAADIGAYRAILGTDRLYAAETLQSYVKQHTTAAERHEAKARWRAARAAKRVGT